MLKLGTTCAAVVFALSSAWAATPTEAVSADIAAQVAILTASSHMAADHTDNPALAAYAAEAADFVQTGRSNAVAGAREPAEANAVDPALASRDTTRATAGLATLNSLRGASFDRLFVRLQRDALRRIDDDYRGIVADGDAVSAGMARDQLLDVARRIEALGRI